MPILNRPRIVFLTAADAKDRRSWSGTHYYMAQALQKHCGDIFYIGPMKPNLVKVGRLLDKISTKLFGKKYKFEYSFLLAKKYAQIAEKKFVEKSFDVIFAPAASSQIIFLNSPAPIIYLSDTTFRLLYMASAPYSRLLNISINEGEKMERLALHKADFVLYPSTWAANSAIDDYHVRKEKVHVIPFGANLDNIPCSETVLKRKKSNQCRLLFLGVDWQRKGGEIAFETLLKLEEFGIEAELIVCGCKPPSKFFHDRMTVIPLLDKNDEEQHSKLMNLFLTSDFLFLPTRSECYGIVFCEANAFGLPVITTNSGGVSGVITNGQNGFMLPITAKGSDYAKLISEIYQDDQRYYQLVKSSRSAFEKRLNWDAWALEVKKIITQISGDKKKELNRFNHPITRHHEI